jgi:uncharacterized phage protein gp47/JayE
MPAPFGLQSTGFSLKTFADIKTALEQRITSIFGPVDLSPESQFGQLIAAYGEEMALLWQGQQDLWNGQDPRTNTGVALDNSAALVGITRLPATYTQVYVTFSGTNGTVVPASTKVSILNGEVFSTIAPGTISGGSVSILCQAVNAGAIKAPAGSITILQNPIAGVTAVTNPLDPYIAGQDLENDDRLRARRGLVFSALGRDSVTAIRASILQVSNVTDCYVYENVTDSTDANLLPAHSFNVVVAGGLDASIAAEIFKLRKLGIKAYGTTTVNIADSQGVTVPIGFSRPVNVSIYLKTTVTVDKGLFPIDGLTQIKADIIAKAADTLHMGSDVYASAFIPPIYDVQGVVSVLMPGVGRSASPTAPTEAIKNDELAVFDTSRLDITINYI